MTTEDPHRGVLTFAFGAQKYADMAKSLAYSLMLNSPSDKRAVVTDSTDPTLLGIFDIVIPYRPGYGANVRQKVYLDLYSPFETTLFIDSDSLVVNDLAPMWAAFAGKSFTVNGHSLLRSGDVDEHLDLEFLLQHLRLKELPKFNGGIYYFDRSHSSAAFFATARDLLRRSGELRFKDFRGDGPGDESVYAAAMAIHDLKQTDMGQGGMWTPVAATTPITVDIPHGICHFDKCGRSVQPHIIHFAGFTDSYIYRRERHKLDKIAAARFASIPQLGIADTIALLLTVPALRIRKLCLGILRRTRQYLRAAAIVR